MNLVISGIEDNTTLLRGCTALLGCCCENCDMGYFILHRSLKSLGMVTKKLVLLLLLLVMLFNYRRVQPIRWWDYDGPTGVGKSSPLISTV